ncbi:NADPH-dependent FMN reductase [Marinomonas foliarum]|uniref:FMN reductase n=1 Tax=Marinomonas foliarum TaxID=491950 RepID=A0A368ZXP5_9GAMM|nr:NADPH-dependent FMN reductase [Marinomonas foliarum]RCX01048.1 FMN reductase [Marinomonas foliarum]
MSKKIVLLLGSPNSKSRSTALAHEVVQHLTSAHYSVEQISIDDISEKALLRADFKDKSIQDLTRKIVEADGIITATPVYKASISAFLKSLIDVLPENALKGKTVLSVASGGSAAHLLAVDNALHPIISSLKAERFIPTVYATDSEIQKREDGSYHIESVELKTRLKQAATAIEQSFSSGLSAASETYHFRLALL